MTNTQFVLASDSNPRVAGGIESTATDFGRFMDMLLNDGVDRVTSTRVLAAASVAEILTRQTSDDQIIVNSPADNNLYGIGVWVDQLVQAGPPVDALAAGARGFHSWIDKSYGLVMTFATEETVFANVEVLSSMMHTAILQAVATPAISISMAWLTVATSSPGNAAIHRIRSPPVIWPSGRRTMNRVLSVRWQHQNLLLRRCS